MAIDLSKSYEYFQPEKVDCRIHIVGCGSAGASDPETAVPACIEELKAAGLDKVIEEAQRQIDEFFAK